MKLAVLLVLAGFVVQGCGSVGKSPLELSTDPSSPSTAHVGDVLQVSLEENGSIGSQFDDPQIADTAVIASTGHEDATDSTRNPPAPGSGSTVVWKFKALKPGKTEIRFAFVMRGKPDPSQDVKCNVIVVP